MFTTTKSIIPIAPEQRTIQTTMALKIKSIPVLSHKAAIQFEKKIAISTTKQCTIDFTEQRKICLQILTKAKL